MEGEGQCPARKCFRCFPKLRLWILEHCWVHKATDLHQVLDLIMLPEMDLQPLSLEDAWRLRVASAQAYSIVKNRDVKNFERAMDLMENVYRLLPGLVSPIKHMKIVFGLKTLFIMWMLRERKGMVETMFKINQFFPNKLPQYQGQCSHRDMFLMVRNHVDFRSLAQALTIDRAKLNQYILHQMEEQYGEHYAQKVEDRLLHYLNELQTMLPGKTHVEQIHERRSSATEEEKLLLEVVTADSASIGTTLKTLLHCKVGRCCVDISAQSPEHRTTQEENSPKDLLQTSRVESQQDCFQGALSTQRAKKCRDDEGLQEATPPPQFCSKHGRWVETILQNCSDQAEEPSPASASPLLFLSSSGSSSDDLTPSDLVPQHTPSQSSAVSDTADEVDDRMFKPSGPAERPVQALHGDGFEAPSAGLTTSCVPCSGNGGGSEPPVSASTSDSLVFFPQCSAHHLSPAAQSPPSDTPSGRQPQRVSASASESPAGTDPSLSLGCGTGPVRRPQLKMSVSCQAALLRSKLFQPYVSLTRLRAERRSSSLPRTQDDEHPCCSFDPNTLYSSYSSSSGGDDSLVYDPDYKPKTSKKQLLLEYEAARTFV